MIAWDGLGVWVYFKHVKPARISKHGMTYKLDGVIEEVHVLPAVWTLGALASGPRAKWPLVGWVPGADLKWKQREEGTSGTVKNWTRCGSRGDFFFST